MSMHAVSARIDLLRHGDTGQRSDRGQLDDALTALGWSRLRDTVAGRQWERTVASPMRRCAEFVRRLAQRRRLPLALDARLMESHVGDRQGVPIEDLAEQQREALERFRADPVADPPPGAGTFAAFRQRLSGALDDIARDRAAHARDHARRRDPPAAPRRLALRLPRHGRDRRAACVDPCDRAACASCRADRCRRRQIQPHAVDAGALECPRSAIRD